MIISWPSITPVSLHPYVEQGTPSCSKGTLIASYLELSMEVSSPIALSGRVIQVVLLDFSTTYTKSWEEILLHRWWRCGSCVDLFCFISCCSSLFSPKPLIFPEGRCWCKVESVETNHPYTQCPLLGIAPDSKKKKRGILRAHDC